MNDVSVEKCTHASATDIWKLWVDVDNSPDWDRDVDWSRLHGPFKPGTRGEFKLKGGPRLSFVLEQVTQKKAYSNVVRIPGLLSVRFTHSLEKVSNKQVKVIHGAQISGLLGFILRPLARKKLGMALGSALDNMIDLAESRNTMAKPQ